MIVMLSPTKQMNTNVSRKPSSVPHFKKASAQILEKLKTLDAQNIKKLMKVNEKIAIENVERYPHITFDLNGTPAFMTYSGLQFKHMHMDCFTSEEWTYVEEHIRILSGLYGLLNPFDSIYPYRLEMQCKLGIEGDVDMYAFWKDTLAKQLKKEVSSQRDQHILNLASKEYAKVILPYMGEDVITITFYVNRKGVLKSESTQVKMARGAMVNYLVKQNITQVEEVKTFAEEGYTYQEELSNANEYVFLKLM